MRLTNTLRDAFVRAAMVSDFIEADWPKEQKEAVATA